jgi:hypothetical protein
MIVMARYFLILIILSTSFACLSAQQIVINEVMTANASAVPDPVNYNYSEWIELYNPGSQPVLIAGYKISNDPGRLNMWQVPGSMYIPARGFLIIWTDKLNTGLHTNFRTRTNDEQIFLSNNFDVLIDSVHIKKIYRNTSYGRYPDGSSNWVNFLKPTPKASNTGEIASEQSPAPVFSLPGGRYSSAQTLMITNPAPSGRIYYTTDGSDPGPVSSVYTGSLTLGNTTAVKARIIEAGKIPGPAVTNTYFIREHTFTIPVISVSTDPANLWDPVKGIYVEGTNGIEGFCYGKTNWNQDWERLASFEYFTPQGIKKINTDAGIKINGACSRTFPQKSLGVYFRDKYGADEIRYPLFESKNADRFKSIMLRNSGNDFNRTQFQDAMMTTLIVGQMDIDYLGYAPAALYLNGVYWGIQNIREKSSEDYLYTNYKLDQDSVDMLQGYNTVLAGDNADYSALLAFLNSNSLAGSVNYNYVKSLMDIESYLDYQIAEIYFANLDWPGNNIKYWKSKKPGSVWRWLMYDTDFGFGLASTPDHNTLAFAVDQMGPPWPNPPWSTLLFRKLLENSEFRKRFVDKFNVYVYSTFKPSRVNRIIDSLRNNIAAEMPYHFLRWGGSMSNWEANINVSRDFGNRRPAYIMQYLRSYFGLQAPVSLTVGTNIRAKDRFSVNDIVIHDTIFSGPWFGNREAECRAIPDKDYRFSHWEITTFNASREELVPAASTWQYCDLGTDPPAGWNSPEYNDSTWKSGKSQLGYGDGDEATVIGYGPDVNNKFITSYFRKKFALSDTTGNDSLIVQILADDGAVVYLNGTEIVRVNMPEGTVTGTTLASANPVDENAFLTFAIKGAPLRAGENLIAVEIHQVSGSSSDVSFDLKADLTRRRNLQTEISTTEGIVLNLTSSAVCKAYFDKIGTIRNLYINEFCAKNSMTPDEMGEYDDWIELFNAGGDTLNISGLFMTNSLSDPLAWQIPNSRESETLIPPGDYKILWADKQPEQGALHLNFSLDKSGGEIAVVQLLQGKPIIIDSVIYPRQYTNYSYGRYGDGTNRWFILSGVTPGESNVYTHLAELPNEEAVDIFPNPVRDLLEIRVSEPDGDNLQITVFDQLGRETMHRVMDGSGGQVDVSDLPAGLYVIRIFRSSGSCMYKMLKL